MMTCNLCNLGRTTTHTCLSGMGSESPIILFVFEAPYASEGRSGDSFSGEVFREFERFIDQSGIPYSSIRFEYLVRCVPFDNEDTCCAVRPPTYGEITTCSRYIDQIIFKYKPVIVVPVGSNVLQYFCEGVSSCVNVRGTRLLSQTPNKDIVSKKLDTFLNNSGIDPIKLKYDDKLELCAAHGFAPSMYTFTVFPILHPATTFSNDSSGVRCNKLIRNDLDYLSSLIYNAISGDSLDYSMFTTLEEMKEYCDSLISMYECGEISQIIIDIESNGFVSFNKDSKMLGFGVTHKKGFARFVPYDHAQSPFHGDSLALAAVSCMWNKVVSIVPVTNHNIKFDIHWLYRFGIDVKYVGNCTYLSSWTLLNDTEPHDLEYLATKYTSIKNHKGEMHMCLKEMNGLVYDKNGNSLEPTMNDVDIDVVSKYCCLDCDSTLQLDEVLRRLLANSGLDKPHFKYIVPDILPAVRMERAGIIYDTEFNEVVFKDYENKINEYHAKIYKMGYLSKALDKLVVAKEKVYSVKLNAFNKGYGKKPTKSKIKLIDIRLEDGSVVKSSVLTSPIIKKIILFDILGVKPTKSTDKKKRPHESPSTDKEALEEIVTIYLNKLDDAQAANDDYSIRYITNVLEVVRLFQSFTTDNTIYSRYISKLPNSICDDGKIHTSYGISTTNTTRWTASNPSLHVIPKKSLVKRAFKPTIENGLLGFADYCLAEGTTRNYIMQSASFVGPKKRGWEGYLKPKKVSKKGKNEIGLVIPVENGVYSHLGRQK